MEDELLSAHDRSLRNTLESTLGGDLTDIAFFFFCLKHVSGQRNTNSNHRCMQAVTKNEAPVPAKPNAGPG